MLDIREIQNLIPHRYPFLLVDRILEFEENTRIVGLKNVTVNEPFFQGHFPGYPIMPGVLIIEAMAQTGAALLLNSIPERSVAAGVPARGLLESGHLLDCVHQVIDRVDVSMIAMATHGRTGIERWRRGGG